MRGLSQKAEKRMRQNKKENQAKTEIFIASHQMKYAIKIVCLSG